jgi:hypothetical protein
MGYEGRSDPTPILTFPLRGKELIAYLQLT